MLFHLQDGKLGIVTNSQSQNAKIEKIFTNRIEAEFNKKNIVVVSGFQGIDENENITTLGRGGSDTTAVALAAALKAKHCYIFSDVDGVYSTDPNKVQLAKKITTLSYEEMFEIADEGAKVLHNRCIEIGDRFEMPIITKSTFNNKPGSIIQSKIEDTGVKSIVKNDDLMHITINYGEINLFNDLYNKLINNDIWPNHIVNNKNLETSFLINEKHFNKFQTIIEKDYEKAEIHSSKVTRISLIGYGMTNTADVLSTINNIINENNLNVYSLETSQTKIGITFSSILSNDLLEIFHNKLIK